MKNVHIHTLGCKLNYTESSSIAEQFRQKGFLLNPDNKPDIFIINTCSVTNNAERECRQIVRRIIKKYPDTFVIIMGCYAQIRYQELSKIKGVDLILGNKDKFDIFSYEQAFSKKKKPEIFVTGFSPEDLATPSYSSVEDRTRVFLKVQDGCDYKCSYCTIPFARGNSRSIDLNIIEKSIISLAERGFKEVVITGVNVSDYGKNINSNFFELIKKLDSINEIPRIRISSIEPNNLNDEIIDFIANSKRICHHFHIPLQSGDDSILKDMQRRYNVRHFINVTEKIKKTLPAAGLGFDVIVGFPTETEDKFINTYNLLKEIDFTYLHVFSYSLRPGTKAAKMKMLPKHSEIENRSKKLRELSIRKKTSFLISQLGKSYDVLFESEIKNEKIFGFTGNYIRVGIKANNELINKIVNVKLEKIVNGYCESSLI